MRTDPNDPQTAAGGGMENSQVPQSDPSTQPSDGRISVELTAKYQMALRQIASCESHAPGDVVDIARAALTHNPQGAEND